MISRSRRRYTSGSLENLFLQHSAQVTSCYDQIHAAFSQQDNESLDGDATTAVQYSSCTTPSGSRRWGRSVYLSENDTHDTDSSLNFGVCSIFQDDSDANSFGAHVWDSDVSLDGGSYIENELQTHLDGLGDHETDTDVDPMNAGLYHFYSDGAEDVEEVGDFMWEGMDDEDNTVTALGFDTQLHRSLTESIVTLDWVPIFSPQVEDARYGQVPSVFANMELPELQNYNSLPRDSIGTRGFDELIESLAETEDSRKVARPAAVSFIHTLPQIIIQDHVTLSDLTCAICKDSLLVGTLVNQLPCFHLYHSYCILPWLNTQNSCPLCRYELPTDDADYEDKKQSDRSILYVNIVDEQEIGEENDSSVVDDAEAEFHRIRGEHDRHDNATVVSTGQAGARRFLAAAPVVGIASIVLLLYFGNNVRNRRSTCPHNHVGALGLHANDCLQSQAPGVRDNIRTSRWWSSF